MKVTRTVRTTQEVEACDREGCEGYKDTMYVVLRSFKPSDVIEDEPGDLPVDEWSGTLCGKCLDMIFGRIKGTTKRRKKAAVSDNP